MKINLRIIAGIICLIVGAIVLIVSFYLYEIDSQFIKKIEETPIIITNPAIMGGPIPPNPPYYAIEPFLSMVGTILISVGVLLLSYGSIKNRMKIRK